MSSSNTNYTKKFASQLGSLNEFVDYVRMLERKNGLNALADFRGLDGTWNGKRYLLIKKGGVVDFRHFFAAMTQRLEGKQTNMVRVGPSSEGTTLLLGLLVEIEQCIDETAKRKLDSCFSKEDLISNRLGARFAENIVINQSQAGRRLVSEQLASYLGSLGPLQSTEIMKLKMPSNGDVFLESVGAVLKSLSDVLIPTAY